MYRAMDKLWAPWRIGYIRNVKKQRGCLFCRTVKEISDKDNFLVFRSKHVFSMLNKFPYNNGHMMISPNRHIRDLGKLTEDELADLMAVLNKMQKLLRKTLKPDAFNVGMNIGRIAGAGIPDHLHLHIVPRWKEDTNFMPVVFDTKVISQSLEELYEQLHQKI